MTRTPDAPPPTAGRLAASRYWSALAERRLAEGDPGAAAECARRGLEALGGDYAPPGTKDDTEPKRLAAEERLREGHAEAARALLRVLDDRQEMYVERHRDGSLG